MEALQAGSNPDLLTSFDGLTNYDRRFARGGNQVSAGEPPDQGLCVGNGYVLESVNTVLRVYDTKGKALTKAIAQSEFYGYPPNSTGRPAFGSRHVRRQLLLRPGDP